MGIQLTAVLGIVGGSAALCASPGGSVVAGRSIAGDTPAQILSIASAATTKAGSFTLDCRAAVPSAGVGGTTVTNVSADVGTQRLSNHIKSLGLATAVIRFVGGVAYFEGNAVYLQFEYNVAHSKYANRWISVSKGQKGYAAMASGMTTSSVVLAMGPVGKISKSKIATFDKTSVVSVNGAANPYQYVGTGSQRIYVAVAAPNRPVGLTVSATESGFHITGACTFVDWRVKFVVKKPATSTPINKTNL
jgi:hypothetical protein